MRIGVAATPSMAIPTLDWLVQSEHDLNVVITQPDKPAGRGRALKESVVSQWAQAHKVACLKPQYPEQLRESLTSIDLVITIGYGVILPLEILTIPRFGFINLHFSLLPSWRGAAPVQRAILHGDHPLGVTVFALDAGMDTGPIYVQREVKTDPDSNAGEILEAMAAMGPEVISETLHLIRSSISPTAQESARASYAPKISKQEAQINWNRSALEVDRLIRAFTPEPGAWTTFRESSIRVGRARLISSPLVAEPGQIVVQNGNLLISCAEGEMLFVEEVTPAGKKRMSAQSWVNGSRIVAGDKFV